MLYVAGTVSQTMEHFWACHQHAFDFFGGIPHTVMVDNRTSAVLKRAVGDAPVLNPTSLDFATHHGFPIAPCNVGKGNEKGRVDNGVGSVKKHSLAGLAMPDCSALNPAARHWLDTVANGRLHGATREQPTVLWHTARPSLRPLPLHPFDIAPVAQVRASRPLRMTVETNRSAVPAQYAGHTLTRKTSPIVCASIWVTSSLPAMPDAMIGSKMWQIRINPSRSWNSAKKPAITSSSCGFSRCPRGLRRTTFSSKRIAAIRTTTCAKWSP